MGAANAMLTREDSEWSRKFEEPWQSRARDWGGVGQFFSPRPRQMACQVPSMRQGGDALTNPTLGGRCNYQGNQSDHGN